MLWCSSLFYFIFFPLSHQLQLVAVQSGIVEEFPAHFVEDWGLFGYQHLGWKCTAEHFEVVVEWLFVSALKTQYVVPHHQQRGCLACHAGY